MNLQAGGQGLDSFAGGFNRIYEDCQNQKYFPGIAISDDDEEALRESLLLIPRALRLRNTKNTCLYEMQKEYSELIKIEVWPGTKSSDNTIVHSKDYKRKEETIRVILNAKRLKYSKVSSLEKSLYELKRGKGQIDFDDVARLVTGLHAAKLLETEKNTISLRDHAKRTLKHGNCGEAMLIFFYLFNKIKTDSLDKCIKVITTINERTSHSGPDNSNNLLIRLKSLLLTELSTQYIQNIYYIGKCYRKKKQLLKAYSILKYSILVFSSIHQNHSPLSAKILHTLGNCSYDLKKVNRDVVKCSYNRKEVEKAVHFIRTSLDIQNGLYGEYSRECIANLTDLGKYYFELRQLELSNIYSKLALVLLNQYTPENYPKLIQINRQIADSYYYQRRIDEALFWYREIPTVLNQELEVGHVLNRIGKCYYLKGNYKSALESFTTAINYYGKSLPPAHPLIIKLMKKAAQLRFWSMDILKSIEIIDEALNLVKEGYSISKLKHAAFLSLRALCEYFVGNVNSTKVYKKEAEDMLTEIGNISHPGKASILENLAFIEFWWIDHHRAIDLLQDAKSIKEQFLGPDHWKISITNICLSMNLYQNKDREVAQKLIEEAKEIQQKHFAETHPERFLIAVVSDMSSNLTNIEGRIEFYKYWLEILSKNISEDSLFIGMIHLNILIELRAKSTYEPLKHFQKFWEITEKSLGYGSPFLKNLLFICLFVFTCHPEFKVICPDIASVLKLGEIDLDKNLIFVLFIKRMTKRAIGYCNFKIVEGFLLSQIELLSINQSYRLKLHIVEIIEHLINKDQHALARKILEEAIPKIKNPPDLTKRMEELLTTIGNDDKEPLPPRLCYTHDQIESIKTIMQAVFSNGPILTLDDLYESFSRIMKYSKFISVVFKK